MFSVPQAGMILNETVTENKHQNVAMWLLCAPLSSLRWDRGPSGGGLTVLYDVFRSDEDSEDESLSRGGRQNHDNLYRVHMPSLYSCGSSYGSETSIPAAAHTVSNAPVTEYM